MFTPLEFLYHFRDLLRDRGIRFAITSGMACVYYGLQQNTKDSDWIIEPADLPKLHQLLLDHERRVPSWRISYRNIFGAPLTEEYMAAGWTSHLSIWPTAGSPEEHVDIFGRPPRVQPGMVIPDDQGFASADLVAWMKRTDRDKDWPIVDGLGLLLNGAGNCSAGVLHIQSAGRLRETWAGLQSEARDFALLQRPLLAFIDSEPDDDALQGLIGLERVLWETVNQERHRRYQHAWKEFYRRWKQEDLWDWPTSESFSRQHQRLLRAAESHQLPVQVISEEEKPALRERSIQRALLRTGRPETLVRSIVPPLQHMLP